MAGNSIVINVLAKVQGLTDIEKLKSKLTGLTTSSGFKNAVQGFGIGAGITAWNMLGNAIAQAPQFLAEAARAAMDEEAQINRLTAALKANVPGWDGNIEAVEKQINAYKRLAFSDEEMRDGLTKIIPVVGDVSQSFRVMRVAMDLARLKGISLEDASTTLVKAFAGQMRGLKDLGIELKSTASDAQILTEVERRAAGQAEAFAESHEGMAKRVGDAWNDMQEDIGKSLLQGADDMARSVDHYDWAVEKVKTLEEAAVPFMVRFWTDPRLSAEAYRRELAELARQQAVLTGLYKEQIYVDGVGWFKANAAAAVKAGNAIETMGRVAQSAVGNFSSAVSVFDGSVLPILLTGLGDISAAGDDAAKMFDSMRKSWKRWDDSLEEQRRYEDLPLLIKQAAGRVKTAEAELTAARKSGNRERIIDAQLALREAKRNLADLRTELKRTDTVIDTIGTSALTTATALARLIAKMAQINAGTYGAGGHLQSGGLALPGLSYTVGEAGPETLVMGRSGGLVIPGAGAGMRSNTTPVQNTIVVQVDGRELARVLDERQYWMLQTAPVTTRAS